MKILVVAFMIFFFSFKVPLKINIDITQYFKEILTISTCVPNLKIDENNKEPHLALIDPTGTYKLLSKRNVKNGEVYGYSGRIQVKRLTTNRIVMTFYVNKGAPSYNSGSFVDTLTCNNNVAVYTAPKDIDPTCKMTFIFNKKGVKVFQKSDDYNFGCGFGHAVVVSGFYKRISSRTPVLTEPLTGEKLEK